MYCAHQYLRGTVLQYFRPRGFFLIQTYLGQWVKIFSILVKNLPSYLNFNPYPHGRFLAPITQYARPKGHF